VACPSSDATRGASWIAANRYEANEWRNPFFGQRASSAPLRTRSSLARARWSPQALETVPRARARADGVVGALSLLYDTAAVYFGKREIMWAYATLDAVLPSKTAVYLDYEDDVRKSRKPRKTAQKKLTADRSTTELRWIFFRHGCGA
jgi:hypothetical protein